MNTIIRKYTANDKMSDLIDTDYRILQLLNKLDIPLGFGEQTVQTICTKQGINTQCFLFLANLQTNKTLFNYQEVFNSLSLIDIINFLRKSHSYFIDKRLPYLKINLQNAIKNISPEIQTLLLRFFDNYSNEVDEHMNYENNTVFPYIHALIEHANTPNYTIQTFQADHTDIEGKMADLFHIFTKYIPCQNNIEMTQILLDLYMLQEELDTHTFIEEELLIPRIKELESDINK